MPKYVQPLSNEAIANRRFETLDELQEAQAELGRITVSRRFSQSWASPLLSCFVMSSCRCVYERCLLSRVPAETQMTTTKNMIAHQQSQHFFSLAFLFQRGPPFSSLGKDGSTTWEPSYSGTRPFAEKNNHCLTGDGTICFAWVRRKLPKVISHTPMLQMNCQRWRENPNSLPSFTLSSRAHHKEAICSEICSGMSHVVQ
jgi:hypothetical protein